MENPKELTKAEEKVMQILWDLERSVVRDMVEKFEEPKPSYTTVATVLKVLEKKGFVAHRSYANVHEYYPLISREAYSQQAVSSLTDRFFGGSLKQLVSFFINTQPLDIQDLNELNQLIEEQKKNRHNPS